MKNLKDTRLRAVRRHDMILLVSILFILIWTAIAPGQLGMGDSKGIAQQRLKPRLIHISGKLQEIKTHPCENTTGKAELGTHLILKDMHDQELNIHLGPAPSVSETVKRLTIGTKLDLLGFRTEKMPPNHYVAKTLILANHIVQLRGSDLRPYWSNNRLNEKNPSSFMATTGKRITSETPGSHCYYPKFWQRRCFQGRRRPYWERPCCGRTCYRKW